jgi:hypothetical protein
LTASPDAGFIFTGWSGGACTGTGICVISANANVTAAFGVPAAGGPAAPASSEGGGGCTLAQAGTNDALLPTLFLVTLGALLWRLRQRSP